MKEDWQKDIHDRLGSYEKDAPEGLWENITRKMADAEGNAMPRKSSSLLGLQHPVYAAAAASIALLLGYSVYSGFSDRGQDLSSGTTTHTTDYASAKVSANTDNDNVAAINLKSKTDLHLAYRQPTSICDSSPLTDGNESADDASYNNTEDADGNNEQETLCKANSKKGHQNDYRMGYGSMIADNAGVGRNASSGATSRWTLSTCAMGAMGASKSYMSMSSVVAAAGADNSYWTDSPMLGISLFNSGREVKTEYKHHFPVTIGLKIAYAINKRMSIESGLTYTRLSSDMREGTAENYYTGEQKLNYVGIPVSFRYNAVSYKRLNLYGVAGVMAEKCVSGTSDKEYFINNTSRKSETLSIDSKPLQMSVNAAVGVQLKVLGGIGIYAEPGVSYHFDDGSSLQTIYKEKPLNFNINVGLRYTIGENKQ